MRFQRKLRRRINWIAPPRAFRSISPKGTESFQGEIARGSALECAAFLDVLVVRRLASESQIEGGKERLVHVVRMLMGLLRRFSESPAMIREDEWEYEQEQEKE